MPRVLLLRPGLWGYWQAFGHGVLYAVITVCLQVLIGIGIALLLHMELRGRNWLRSAAMTPYILPTVVVVYIWKWVLDVNHGLVNAFLSRLGFDVVEWFGTPFMAWLSVIFVSVWHWTPFVTITFLAALQTVPDDLYDAAAVDGANGMAASVLCHATRVKACADRDYHAAQYLHVQQIRYRLAVDPRRSSHGNGTFADSGLPAYLCDV
jgi:ABC-type spermidine/putrescine transport system permease subunit I